MSQITINLDEEVKKILSKRAKSNLFNLREQIEDILRRSAVSTKNQKNFRKIKVDDRIVAAFSRDKRGRKRKK